MYVKAITTDKEFNSLKNEWIDFKKKVVIEVLLRPIFGREPDGNILRLFIIDNRDIIKMI